MLTLHTRTRPSPNPIAERTVRWDPIKTAIIVCDMWDRHWCRGASERVGELAPFINEVLDSARQRGILIVHAPSDTMDHYRDYPQRLRIQKGLQAEIPLPKPRPLEPPLPIDDSDEGCTTQESSPHKAWTCQHPAIHIASEDAISDDGAEIYSLFEQSTIENVIMMGVHTNMCVLGRSFGIRRLVEIGKTVVLTRDLTDSMYNPARPPFVSHFEGTALVVAHIETYLCPTIESSDLTDRPAFRFREGVMQ